jgi:thymidylate synthase
VTRFYRNFAEAQNEIRRDLAELGMQVHPETMQDKDIADDPDFDTRELVNYIYIVMQPDWEDLTGVHMEWVEREWDDRVTGGLNPGTACKKRPEVWDQFLENPMGTHIGRFSYTYSQRMGGAYLQSIIDELRKHPNSRQLYLSVWDRVIDPGRRGDRRVPCSLGYWFVQRGGKLDMTYMMRSCDFHTHWANDVALATMMLHFVAAATEYEVGALTHFVGSLHVYQKDVADVF